jgi:hypothetical protein
MPGPSFNPEPSSIQISRMLRRPPPVTGIGFKPGVAMSKGAALRAPPAPLAPRRPKFAFGGAASIPDHPLMPVTGPINTSTLGRADADPTHVPPGSYVMPADIVSHLGEGNTAAGQEILAKMFLPLKAQAAQGQLGLMRQGAPYGGTGAPWGAAAPKLRVGEGVGIPKGIAPRIEGLPKYPVYAGPGQQGPNFVQAHGGVVPGEPGEQFLDRMGLGQKPGTPINISGGEFVVPPEEVARRGKGDIEKGHEILDKWVNHLRQEHIKTLRKLPGPAK